MSEVPDEPWVERYQRSLRPFPLGRSFLVLQSEEPAHAAVPSGRVALRLVAGRAFGTGEHATTRMCVELLEELVEPGRRWLDLGTGSGILAVVAALRGARVLALDTDPVAIEVAREVLAANAVAERVQLREGTLDVADGPWDGIVANIEGQFFLGAARPLARSLAPGGALVASGIVREAAAEVGASLAGAGLYVSAERSDQGWSALLCRRR